MRFAPTPHSSTHVQGVAEVRSRLPFVFVALASVVLSGQQGRVPAPPQEPPAVTFKTEVNYVEVGAVVTDAQGNFVRTLNKDDFQILEDGKPQKISAYSLVDVPIERADPARRAGAVSFEPDVASNAAPFQGRLYLIVLDDLHTDIARTGVVKAAVRRFIEQNLADNDLAAVVATSGRLEGAQMFTSNRRLLLQAVGTFVGRKLRSAILEKLDDLQVKVEMDLTDQGGPLQEGKTINDALDVERGQEARTTLLNLRNLAEALSSLHGRRKAMIWVSEGIDYSPTTYEENREISGNARLGVPIDDAFREAIRAASRANVSIYGVDPRGLTSDSSTEIEIDYVPDDPNLRLDSSALLEELRTAQGNLRALSDQTGGFASVNANDLATAFDRIARDNTSYYMLGYYPANEKRDGKFHNVEVRVNKPGLQVRARKGYLAPPRTAPAPTHPASLEGSPDLADALTRPIQTSGFSLQANAAAFRGTAPNASLAVSILADGHGFKFAEKNGWSEDRLEVSVKAIGAGGTIRGSEHFDLNIRIRPDSVRTFSTTGFRVVSKIDVPPGKYELHIGAREAGSGSIGTIYSEVEVPDFAKPLLSMSSLAMTSVATGGIPTGRPEVLRDLLPIVPTAARVFHATDEITVYAECYDNATAQPHTLDVTTSILDNGGKAIVSQHQERSSADLQATHGRFSTAARIPLASLAPGKYVMRLEAASRFGTADPVSREAPFRVEP
jgi:VWFA-related protein